MPLGYTLRLGLSYELLILYCYMKQSLEYSIIDEYV